LLKGRALPFQDKPDRPGLGRLSLQLSSNPSADKMYSNLFKATLLWAASASCQSLVVNTTSGTVVGLINGTTPDVTQFLGVPFAKAPTGALRFLPPIAAVKAKSPIDATQFPLACPQFESASKNVYSVDAREFLITRGATSEDCLKASIWVPSSAVPAKTSSARSSGVKGLPIIVWIYGMCTCCLEVSVVSFISAWEKANG
jgi:acetylcholinesterase